MRFSEEDFITVERCLFCGGITRKMGVYLKTPLICHTKCMGCCAVSYDKIIKPEKIAALYANYAYFSETKSKVTFSNVDRFACHLFRYCKKFSNVLNLNNRELKIMDVGGGDGALSYALAQKLIESKVCPKVNIAVIDYEKSLIQSKCENVTLEHFDSLELIDSKKSFDIIVASAVLEHLPNLGADWKRIVSHFADNGLMYIRTPYKYPLFNLLRKVGIRISLHFPEHIWDLGGDFYKYLETDGLKLVVSRPSIVETSFKMKFFTSLAAHCLKALWFICRLWPFVGGWEAVLIKNEQAIPKRK